MRAAISCEMKRIDEKSFCSSGYCDEIVHNASMEIATGQRSCFQCLEADGENDGL